MKKQSRAVMYFFALLVAVLSVFYTTEVKADDDFEIMGVPFEKTESEETDSYIFKLTNKGALTVYTKVGNQRIISETGVIGNIIFNNDYVYFLKMSNKRIRLTVCSTEGTMPRTIKTFAKKFNESHHVDLEHIRGGYIYYTEANFDSEASEFVDVYDLKKISLEGTRDKRIIGEIGNAFFGKSRILYFEPAGDYGPMTVYSVDYNGKKLKKYKKQVLGLTLDDGKIYFAAAASEAGEYIAYEYNEDFSGGRKLSKAFVPNMIYKIDEEAVYYNKFDDEFLEEGYYKRIHKTGKESIVKESPSDLTD